MSQQYTNGAAGVAIPNGPGHPVHTNGKRSRRGRPQDQAPAPTSAPAPAAVVLAAPPPRPPATVFQTGAVETCVWMNPTSDPAHPCVWTVTQSRLYPVGGEIKNAWSLRFADLDAARWGLYLARRWIRKAERRGALLKLFGR